MVVGIYIRHIRWTLFMWLLFITISYSQKLNLFSLAQQIPEQRSTSELPIDSFVQSLRVQTDLMREVIAGTHSSLVFGLPLTAEWKDVELYRYSESSTEVYTIDATGINHLSTKPTVLYTGQVKGVEGSMVTMYVLNGALRGVVHMPGVGSFNLGPSPGFERGWKYTLISHMKSKGKPMECSAIDELYFKDRAAIESRIVRSTCKKVKISVHADYDLYVKLGASVQNVVDFVKGVFYSSAQIYRKDGIHVQLSEIVVHVIEDNLPHTSASDDLWAFKQVFNTYNGDLVMLLSGYTDSNGEATLGGTAFTNSLCIRRYSYAYGNVEVNLKSYPKYSWDIHVFTHEIGHILGSPHTHDCVWGPNRDSPIDGCYPSGGGCAKGPIPNKGTIMSYCHLPGNPGVDFTLGFGREPGDKIRAKLESSSCLNEYIPGGNLPVRKGIYTANVECSDGDVIYYYDDNNTVDEGDDLWLLSIDTRGEEIGHIGDPGFEVKVEVTSQGYAPTPITSGYVPAGEVFNVINRYWSVRPVRQPTRPVSVHFPFTQDDISGLNQALGGVSIEQVKVYKISAPGNPNPLSNHAGATNGNYRQYTFGNWPSLTTWSEVYSTYGDRVAEFEVDHFSGGGLGVYSQGTLAANLNEFNAYAQGSAVQLEWSTAAEANTALYEIQHSYNGGGFEAIGCVEAAGDASRYIAYSFTDASPGDGKNYYRLKIIDKDHSVEYSSIIEVQFNSWKNSSSFRMGPNPVSMGYFYIYPDGQKDAPVELRIYNASGQCVHSRALAQTPSTIKVNTFRWARGMYVIQVIRAGNTSHQTLVVY